MVLDNLILQTKCFPFTGDAPAESFLEKEIHTLASFARNVYILAYDAPASCQPRLELPDNVRCFPLLSGSISKPKALLRGLTTPGSGRESLRPDRQLFYRYFLGKSQLRFDMVKASDFLSAFRPGKTLLYNFWFFDYARTGILLAELLRQQGNSVRCISRAHGYDVYAYRNPMNYLPMRPWLLERYDYVFPCSQDGTRYLQERYPDCRHKIRTMYLGTKDYGIQKTTAQQPFTLVSCSRVVEVKRVDRIVEALALLAQRHEQLHWVHIGDGPLMAQVEALAKEKLSGTSVTWEFTGSLPNEAVMDYYSRSYADCFVNVSSSEGLPLSIMEAMSFGIPAVATDVGGTAEIVSHGETGYLLPKDFSPEDLAEQLLQMKQQGSRFRPAARARWEADFQYAINTANMLSTAC